MTDNRSARTAIHRTPPTALVALAVAGAVLLGVAGCRSDAFSAMLTSLSASSASADHRGDVADGVVPEGVTVHEDGVPAVANLESDLLGGIRRAAADSAEYGITMTVNSGWRSAEYQERLVREGKQEYGSAEEAARWVATPEGSSHVSGSAIDIGPTEAAEWLSRHGAGYGLCQIYRNEPWHYELRPEAVADGCPPMYADPTEDPRTRR